MVTILSGDKSHKNIYKQINDGGKINLGYKISNHIKWIGNQIKD